MKIFDYTIPYATSVARPILKNIGEVALQNMLFDMLKDELYSSSAKVKNISHNYILQPAQLITYR